MVRIESSEEGLVFRLCEHTPDVLRQVLLERGWSEYEDGESNEGEWNLWWRTQRFRKSEHAEVASWQRLNHFPRTDAITRKDCLVRNLRRMKCVHGTSMYNFHPLSYILPNEYTKFVSDYGKESQKSGKNAYWICKPTDLSRGRGIFVFKDLKDLNYDCPVIVQKYISSPLLISGYKFDLRIYVCVPSFQPLTIYIYQEGIVRFSTDKFDLNQLRNVFSHLTNTSINKYGPAYSADKERVGPGCKWTLSQLRHFLRQMDNVDETLLWQRITNIVTLTLAAQAPTVPKSQSCFELFGFDILIDQDFKPWLLEVNFSPALSMDCQADFIAKRSMLNDLVDLLNFKPTDAERGGKAYKDCRSPSPYNVPRRLRTAKTQSLSEGDATFEGAVSFGVTGKFSTVGKRRFTPRDTHLVKGGVDFVKRRNALPKVVKTSSGHAEEHSLEVDALSLSSIPRNLSSGSMASSQSSGDSQDKSMSYDHVHGRHHNELKLPRNPRHRHSPIVDNRTDLPLHQIRGCYGLEPQQLTARSLPGLHFSATSTLPKIKVQTKTVSKAGFSNTKARRSMTPLRAVLHCDASTSNTVRGSVVEGSNGHISSKESRRQQTKRKTGSASGQSHHTSDVSKSTTRNNFLARKTSLGTSPGGSHKKHATKYRSPYSIRATVSSRLSSSNPWPRTRVGDFVLAFPCNEAMRKASGSNFDTKIIIREMQKIMKKLTATSRDGKLEGTDKRRASATITRSEALELSFMLKFEDKDANPLYFWGPQHPPLLSNVLS